MEEQRFATKEEILKNLKQQYKKRRLTYKEYMVEVHRTEKHYDEWLAEYEKTYGNSSEYDMTNEELAIGQRMSELQGKQTPVETTDVEEKALENTEETTPESNSENTNEVTPETTE
jgi:hypothetical protein